MTQERIAFFEQVLSKPMAEPHRSWIAELLQAARNAPRYPAPDNVSKTPETTAFTTGPAPKMKGKPNKAIAEGVTEIFE